MAASERSYEKITVADLKRLAGIARLHREDFFRRHPEWSILYRERVLCVALCDDAALHFSNGRTGVATFSVWTFYAEHPEAPFPHWRSGREDFGSARFGRAPDSAETYVGRPVVLSSRSLEASLLDDPVEQLQLYLRRGVTPSARELSRKGAVILAPARHLGYVAWPTLVPPD